MNKILFIDASVRKESRTHKLAEYLMSRLDGEKTVVRLSDEYPCHLDAESLKLRQELIAKKDYSHPIFKFAKQFADCDTAVICAPYWDLSFPAIFKEYIENICVSTVTFEYVNGIPQSLCNVKKVYYVTTAGGEIFANLGYDYVKVLFEAFFKVKEFHLIKAEHLDVIGADAEKIIEGAKQDIDALTD